MKTKAVLLDIDETLSSQISWLALTRDLGAPVNEHERIYEDYKSGKISYEQAKNELLALWRLTGNANKKFFRELFEQWPLRPNANEVVAFAKRDHTVCLITGSMDMYAEIVARKLNVKHWYANTSLIWDEHGNLADIDYELDQSTKKLEQFMQFCDEQGIKPQECIVVGDSDNDIKLFEASGRGVLIAANPDQLLSKRAWKTASNLGELEQILLDA